MEQKDSKPLTPRPASPDWADAGYGEGEPTRCAHARPAVSLEHPPGGPAAGTGRGGKGGFESSPVAFQHVLGCCGHSLVSRPRTMVCHPSKKILEIIWNDSIREKFTPALLYGTEQTQDTIQRLPALMSQYQILSYQIHQPPGLSGFFPPE